MTCKQKSLKISTEFWILIEAETSFTDNGRNSCIASILFLSSLRSRFWRSCRSTDSFLLLARRVYFLGHVSFFKNTRTWSVFWHGRWARQFVRFKIKQTSCKTNFEQVLKVNLHDRSDCRAQTRCSRFSGAFRFSFGTLWILGQAKLVSNLMDKSNRQTGQAGTFRKRASTTLASFAESIWEILSIHFWKAVFFKKIAAKVLSNIWNMKNVKSFNAKLSRILILVRLTLPR